MERTVQVAARLLAAAFTFSKPGTQELDPPVELRVRPPYDRRGRLGQGFGGARLLVVLCERIRWVSDLYEDAVFLDLPARLSKHLLRLAQAYGERSL